jgi:hypothetical protein
MTETLEKAPHDIEREVLQNYLATIDRRPDKLQQFVEELYHDRSDNPQILYAAATHLTALTHLDHRADTQQEPELPDRQDAMRAFSTYTRLMAMIAQEKDAPLYADDERVRRRLVGALEELAFHAPLTYAAAQGADFMALPSPAAVDFVGMTKASDLQIFFPESETDTTDIQVRFNLEEDGIYEPHIAVLNLTTVLGDTDEAAVLRGLLKDIGKRPDNPEGELELGQREHDIIMGGSAAILQAARNWQA